MHVFNRVSNGTCLGASQVALVVKKLTCQYRKHRDVGLIPGLARSGGGNGNPLQYSYLGNPMDRGAWRAAVHGVAESWTRLSAHTQLTEYVTHSLPER